MSERDKETGPGRGNRPIETIRDGALKVSIFRNRSENGNFYSLDPGRIYTDEKSGKVREVSSLSGSEPLRMAQLLTKGYARVGHYKEQEKQDRADERERPDEGRERGASSRPRDTRSRNRDDGYER